MGILQTGTELENKISRGFGHDELESRRACQRSGKQEDFIISVRSQEEFTI